MKKEKGNFKGPLDIEKFLNNLCDNSQVHETPIVQPKNLDDFLKNVRGSLITKSRLPSENNREKVRIKGVQLQKSDNLLSAMCKLCSSPVLVTRNQQEQYRQLDQTERLNDPARQVKTCLLQFINSKNTDCVLKF